MVWEAVKLAEEMVSGAEEAVWDMDMGGVFGDREAEYGLGRLYHGLGRPFLGQRRLWYGLGVPWLKEALTWAGEAVTWAGEDVFGHCFGAQMSMLKQVGNNILYCLKEFILILVYPIFRSLRIKTVFYTDKWAI